MRRELRVPRPIRQSIFSLTKSLAYEILPNIKEIQNCVFSPTPTIVTIKLGRNAHSATSYIRINFEPYKAISASDIEPSPLKFQKFIKNSFTGEDDSFLDLD